MGNSGLLWKILIVENRFINEIIDKVDHSSVVNSCKNKDQMLASSHSLTSFTRSFQQALTFFLKKSTETPVINYLNSSIKKIYI